MTWYLLRHKEGNGFVSNRIFRNVYYGLIAIHGSVAIEEFPLNVNGKNVERIISIADIYIERAI